MVNKWGISDKKSGNGRYFNYQERSSSNRLPVVNIALGIEIPAVDGVGDAIEHFITIGLFDFPALGSVRDHVSQDASSIVTHLQRIKYHQLHFSGMRKKSIEDAQESPNSSEFKKN